MTDPVRSDKEGLDISAESWEYATAFAETLGTVPSSVSSLVRSLLAESVRDGPPEGDLSSSSHFLLSRFLNSPSLQAAYFYSLSYVKPGYIGPPDEAITKNSFMSAFSPAEHAFMIAVLFLHRQVRKLTQSEQFAHLTRTLQLGLNAGWLIGSALPAVGPFVGLAVGAYRWLGVMTFLRHDPSGFKEYYSGLQNKRAVVPDLAAEIKRWNCCSAQVGILLLQRAGVDGNLLDPLLRLMLGKVLTAPQDQPYYAVEQWLRCFLEAAPFPTGALRGDLYVSMEAQLDIAERLTQGDKTTKFNWLSATPRDITPKSTPQLFVGRVEAGEHSPDQTAD
jgi:hypothetical protein